MRIILYHVNCRDGHAAALIAYYYAKENNLDFKFIGLDPRDQDQKVLQVTDYIEWQVNELKIDPTTLKIQCFDVSLKELNIALLSKYNFEYYDHHTTSVLPEGIIGRVTNDISGVHLAWDVFYPGKDLPLIFRYVEDRDLWRYREEFSREINEGLYSLNMVRFSDALIEMRKMKKVETTDQIAELTDQQIESAAQRQETLELWCGYFDDTKFNLDIDKYRIIGQTTMDYRKKLITSFKYYITEVDFESYRTAMVNTPLLISDAGEFMVTDLGYDIAFMYYVNRGTIQVSLRSNNAKQVDVSAIAKKYGGGGHKHASGFTCNWEFISTLFATTS